MDYTIFNGGDNASAVCVGFYVADSLGFYVTTAINVVATNSEFACIDPEFARTVATKHAKERYPNGTTHPKILNHSLLQNPQETLNKNLNKNSKVISTI